MCDRSRERQSRCTDSVTSWAASLKHWCELCNCGLEILKKENNVGHFNTESKITEKKTLVSTKHLKK